MIYIIAFAILTSIFWFAANASVRDAMTRRASRLSKRKSVGADVWMDAVPAMDEEALQNVLELIGAELKIAPQYLRPSDSFAGELSLKDCFWSLVVEDDSREAIADILDDMYGERPSAEWRDLRDVLMDFTASAHVSNG